MRHEPPSDCGPQGHLHGIFEYFVKAHTNRNLLPVARRYAGFRGLPDVAAEDILAEGLTRVWPVWCSRGLNKSVCEVRLAFIYKTISNVAQEEVRKRDRAGIVTDCHTIPETPSGIAGLDRVILGREALAIVTRVLATLNEQDRLIVDLRIANLEQASLRADMYDLLEAALLDCAITEDQREPFIDLGDGALLLVRPADSVPKTLLVNTFVPALSERLAEHAEVYPDRGFRLRVAIHAGEVHFDRKGVFGEDVDITFRLLHAPELKLRLRRTTAPLALAVSDDIHRSVARHGYAGIDIESFLPLIQLDIGGEP